MPTVCCSCWRDSITFIDIVIIGHSPSVRPIYHWWAYFFNGPNLTKILSQNLHILLIFHFAFSIVKLLIVFYFLFSHYYNHGQWPAKGDQGLGMKDMKIKFNILICWHSNFNYIKTNSFFISRILLYFKSPLIFAKVPKRLFNTFAFILFLPRLCTSQICICVHMGWRNYLSGIHCFWCVVVLQPVSSLMRGVWLIYPNHIIRLIHFITQMCCGWSCG